MPEAVSGLVDACRPPPNQIERIEKEVNSPVGPCARDSRRSRLFPMNFALTKREWNMNDGIAMSEEKRTYLIRIGIVALCIAGVLKLLTHLVPHTIFLSLLLNLLIAAAGLTGIISFWKNRPIHGKLVIARQRNLGATLACGAIYFAFAALLFLSVYTSSAQLKFAGDVALWFFLAFLHWDTSRASRQFAA